MNNTSTFLKYFLFLFFITPAIQLKAQCNTNIISVRDTISCGDSLELNVIGVGGAYMDDFTPNTLNPLWQSVTTGYIIGMPCGPNTIAAAGGGQHLWFTNGSATPRTITTIPVDVSFGGNICFDFKTGTHPGGLVCDGPEGPNEGVYLQYKTSALGATWTDIQYLSSFPTNQYNSWQNFCYVIPPAAMTVATQFRWNQIQTSGPDYDQWGIDNVSIDGPTGYTPLWNGGTITGSTQLSEMVAPFTTITYDLTFSNWVDDTCTASKTIVVEQPTIDVTLIDVPCDEDTLSAEIDIKRYCEYTLKLWNYLPGTGATQQGWGTGGAAPNNYHFLNLNNNNVFYNSYSMVSGGNNTFEIYTIPVTDGDVLDFLFNNSGNASDECKYTIIDSQSNNLTPPVGIGFPGSSPTDFSTIASCPSTTVYNYNWTNLTTPITTGINTPNVNTTTASFTVPTQVQVYAYDANYPLCNITDTINVSPNISIDAAISGATAICEGDTLTLGFTLTGIPPFTLVLDTGGNTITYNLDNNGNNISNGNPVTFTPTNTATYTILSITDSTGCIGAISTASLTTTINTLPYAGEEDKQEICINSTNAYDLNFLISNENPGGIWTNSVGAPISAIINPSTYGAGTHQFTYIVLGASPCPNDTVVTNITIHPQPVVSSFSASPTTVAQGSQTTLTIVLTGGSPGYNIIISDNNSNTQPLSINAPDTSGTLDVTPTVISPTTYSILSIVDTNGCTANSALTTDVIVEPTPIVNPFTTLTPEICEGTIPNVDMNLASGTTPVTVYYSYNGTNYTEIFNTIGSTNIDLDTSILNLGINTITIDSVIDNSGTHSPTSLIPAPLDITIHENPSVIFNTTTPEICFGDDGVLEFNFITGKAPYSIDYNINTIPQTTLNNLGSGVQTYTLNPQPGLGTNTYTLTLLKDANDCSINPLDSVTIAVNPTPVLGINISGANPICFGDASAINFPVTSGTPPYVVNYSDAGTPTTINVDANGNLLSSGMALVVNPITATTYTLNNVTDSKGCTNTFANNAILDVKELPNVSISSDVEICEQDVTALAFNFDAGSTPWTVNYTVNGSPSSVTLNNPNDNVSISPSVTTTYIINSVSDAFCTTTVIDSTTLKVNPLATIVLSGGGTACDDGSTIDVNFNTTSGTPPFSINYSIGINPYLISNANPNHTISTNQTGIYTITGLTDSKGCTAKSISGSANVVLIPVNESNITATPERTDIDDPIINFINTASHSVTGTWDFGDGENLNSSINKVSHIYADTGTFIVSFTTAGNGCSEIAYQTVIIDPTFSIFIPNAFTPNSNQSNDYFLPIVKNVAEYDFSIYNRLGERVFNTKDINIGWNGKPYNDGKFSEAGVYIYAIVITDTNGKVRTFEGTITLIR